MSKNTQKSPSSDASTPGRDMTSEVYELITSDDVRLFVHKDVLISQSKPFQEATAGAAERKISLSDWDTDTVARLVEFLYRDDYPYPDPSPVRSGPAPVVPTTEQGESDMVPVEAQLSITEPSTPVGPVTQSRLPPNCPEKVADNERLGPFDPALFDFEKVLLAHAKVYVLANDKGVHFLHALALNRVSLVLSRLQPLQAGSHIARNIAEFASYVYANTDQLSMSDEPLRKITSDFIAVNLVAFQQEMRAVQLIAEGGKFVTDLMANVCRLVNLNAAFSGSSKKRYISNITVGLESLWGSYANTVKDVHGDSNLNPGSKPQERRRLIVEFTDIANDACTSFRFSMDVQAGDKNETLKRALSVEPVKDEKECRKVTKVVLIQSGSDHGLDMEVIKQYDGMSDNISYTSDIGIYLLWKTVRTRFD